LLVALVGCAASADEGDSNDEAVTAGDGGALSKIDHFVVLFMENHSFDNLYGQFDDPRVEGLKQALAHPELFTQVDANGAPVDALLPPADENGNPIKGFTGPLPNKPFDIATFIPEEAETPDLHHIFFTEQMQINRDANGVGRMNQYYVWSDAKALSMGHYDTTKLPMNKYAKAFTLCDHFFHAAFGGSFLNHQWLIAARTPVWKDAPDSVRTVPKSLRDTPGINERQVTPADWNPKVGDKDCDGTERCGYVVNTSYSAIGPRTWFQVAPESLVPAQTHVTIGDRLTDKNISWAWYSGGWNDEMEFDASGRGQAATSRTASSEVVGGGQDNFQYHHQPFTFYANYAKGTPGRQHLKDYVDFMAALKSETLPQVSFVKPVGKDNEHPGYSTVAAGEATAVEVVKAIGASNYWKTGKVALFVVYDENGGQWDHVSPPVIDDWGPGTRAPAIVISPWAKRGFIDKTQYDTTSILRTLEARYDLAPLASRDAHSASFANAFQDTLDTSMP
jgi:phospholipase C